MPISISSSTPLLNYDGSISCPTRQTPMRAGRACTCRRACAYIYATILHTEIMRRQDSRKTENHITCQKIERVYSPQRAREGFMWCITSVQSITRRELDHGLFIPYLVRSTHELLVDGESNRTVPCRSIYASSIYLLEWAGRSAIMDMECSIKVSEVQEVASIEIFVHV